MAFKMRRNPLQRNFGIGASTKKTTPYKDKGDHDHPHQGQPSWDESEREALYNQAGMGDAYNKRRGREKPLEVLTKDYKIGSSEIRDANREEGKTAEYSKRLQKSKGATGLLDDLANYEETSLGVSKSKQQQAKRKLEKAKAQADSPVKKTKEQRIQKRKDRISSKFRGNIKAVKTRLDDGDLKGARITRKMLVASAKGKKVKAKRLRRKQEAQDSKFFKDQVKRRSEK